MDKDPASLSNLRDIVLPDPVGLWPPGPGGLILLALLLFCLGIAGYCWYRRWKADRYRRAGLFLLAEVTTERDVSVVLKRVALAAYPREQVASLYGREWLDFLNRTCPGTHFEETFLNNPNGPAVLKSLETAKSWIKHHHLVVSDLNGH